MSSGMQPSDLIVLLNQVVEAFDELTDRYGIDKIKTIGLFHCVIFLIPS